MTLASPSGVAPFVPTDIAGLQLWLKADAITGLSDADPITTWEDSSAANNDAAQGTGGLKPIYKTNIVNGKPVARFDGADDVLNFPTNAFSSQTAAEVFIVIKVDNDPPAADAQSGLWSFGGDFSTHYPLSSGTLYDAFGSANRKTVGDPATSLATWCIYNVTSTSSEWTARLNGTQLFTTGTNTVEFTSASKLGQGLTGLCLDGDVAEMIMYDSGLASGDRASVKDYLAAKYGL